MRRWLKRKLDKEQFQPGIAGLFVNPFYFARKGLYSSMSTMARHLKGRILDVGCGQRPYENLFETTGYVGLEIDTQENRKTKKADIFYDGNVFPFKDGEFDGVVANQVFEHVFYPDRFLGEVRRVLRDGGMLLMTVPFIWDEHEKPYDFARYTSYALETMLTRNGFEILRRKKSVADIRVIFQLLNGYLFKKTVTGNKYVNLLAVLLLMAPVNIMGEIAALFLPKNEDLYLDNIVLARKVADA